MQMNKLNLKTVSQEDIAWEKEHLAAKQHKDLKYLGIGLMVSSLVFVTSVALMLLHIWIIPVAYMDYSSSSIRGSSTCIRSIIRRDIALSVR